MPFTVSFLGEGSPTKIDYRKKGTLILTALLDLGLRLKITGDFPKMVRFPLAFRLNQPQQQPPGRGTTRPIGTVRPTLPSAWAPPALCGTCGPHGPGNWRTTAPGSRRDVHLGEAPPELAVIL